MEQVEVQWIDELEGECIIRLKKSNWWFVELTWWMAGGKHMQLDQIKFPIRVQPYGDKKVTTKFHGQLNLRKVQSERALLSFSLKWSPA